MTTTCAVYLAPYAVKPEESRGRLYHEGPSTTRNEFQRDRDRVIHSSNFRKLKGKTQVFIDGQGDYFRTRLTHSLEVAQVARTLARLLNLHEDLVETLALAHDLGHTCFGHTGEDALAEAMAPFGGFDHNDHTFRILTKLEQRYAEFDGLNLTWETLEGIVKHNGPMYPLRTDKPKPINILEFQEKMDLGLSTYASLEAQIASLADDIAYNSHDVDDGYKSGIFTLADLRELPVFGEELAKVEKRHSNLDERRLVSEAVRHVMGAWVTDLLAGTRANLDAMKPEDAEAVRQAGKPIVAFSETFVGYHATIRKFLMERLYRHERINDLRDRAGRIVRELFHIFMDAPDRLPMEWLTEGEVRGIFDADDIKARLIADYIASMTDRFAIAEHTRLTGQELLNYERLRTS